MALYGNMIGGTAPLKTLKLVDESGAEIVGVVTDSEVIFTATDNDVREGMTYASDCGVSTGTKDIPIYRTSAGRYTILPGESFSIPLSQFDQYDYTTFQCMISLIDEDDVDNSVSISMISIKDGVYEVNSTTKLASVSKNIETQSIDLNMNNNSGNSYLIYYFTYREEV